MFEAQEIHIDMRLASATRWSPIKALAKVMTLEMTIHFILPCKRSRDKRQASYAHVAY